MKTVRDIGEFALIERIARVIPTSPAVLEGIGDDCAVMRLDDRLLLASCDMSVEGVHFRREQAAPDDIGWKVAAAALSDIAAMGGTPRFALAAVSCPPDTPLTFVEELFKGMGNVLSQFGAVIVGGDTTRSRTGVAIDVTVLGEIYGDRYLRRTGAQIGDLLAVTGRLGLSAAGLHALEQRLDAPELVAAHFHPDPRIPEGQWLSTQTDVHAMIDVSDGLAQDAGHLVEASDLGINLNGERIVPAPPLAEYCQRHGLTALDFMLAGGEDYELLFALDPHSAPTLLDSFRTTFRTDATIVGEFTDAWTGIRLDGKPVAVAGFDHFK
ncbi:MAG: thiamine-phosphate kinase [Candidatus Hydrogenedentes bacterium]|nr:thiamine-phosphate kinase [Candidatus Hydrogenedentota bacterium]